MTHSHAMADAPHPRSWLVDQAYAALRSAILASDYPPGHQVSAQELALRFGMSRTPVQEAALRLQQEGLLEILPKRGIRILALAPEDIREIYDVLIAIEASAAETIATFTTETRHRVADRLDVATAAMAHALVTGDLAQWGEADAAFHSALIEGCGNRRFAAIVNTVNAQAHRARMLTVHLRPTLTRSIDDHHAISAALRNGDADPAHAAARDHRRRARDELLPLIDRIGLRHL